MRLLRTWLVAVSLVCLAFLVSLTVHVEATFSSIVASGGSIADDISTATSTAADTTGATLLIVSCSWYSDVTAEVAASDSKSNTWTGITKANSGFFNTRIFYVNSATPTVGASHTFTCSGTTTQPSMAFIAAKYSAATPLDQQALAGGVDADCAAPITPTEDNELVISAVGGAITDATPTPTGHTSVWENAVSPGAYLAHALGYAVQTTAGAFNGTWAWTGSASHLCETASFKTGAAPADPPVGSLGLLGMGK